MKNKQNTHDNDGLPYLQKKGKREMDNEREKKAHGDNGIFEASKCDVGQPKDCCLHSNVSGLGFLF